MYMIVARYSDDAERKRIEYLFDKWKARVDVSKPDGIVFLIDDLGKTEFNEMSKELYSRIASDNVSIYSIDTLDTEANEYERDFEVSVGGSIRSVGQLLNYAFAKYKGTLKNVSQKPPERSYEVYSRKGRADVRVRLRESAGEVNMLLNIRGFDKGAVDFLHEKLSKEMKYLKEADHG